MQAIVFDFDGVIANSEPLHFQGFRDVLAGEGIVLTEREYYESYLGYDDAGVFRALGTERTMSWDAGQIADLVARKAARLDLLERGRSILFPGAADAIRRTAAVVPIAIASGALGAEIRRVLKRENLISAFTAIVAAEDTRVSKPAPDPYLHALTLLSEAMSERFVASHCVAIEDSRWGLQSARAAGLRTVGITHTYSAHELSDADLIINALEELDVRQLSSLCSG